MNCQIIFLDSVDEIQNIETDGYAINVPRVKKTKGSIFDELAHFLNLSTKEQRENYGTIYIYDDNDHYYLIALDKDTTPKFYQIIGEKK